MMTKKMFVPMLLLLGALFVWGIAEGHEIHLSDIGEQTNVTIEPCPVLSGYICTSDQRECYLVYKQVDLQHSAMHVQDLPLNQDGECVCPTIGE